MVKLIVLRNTFSNYQLDKMHINKISIKSCSIILLRLILLFFGGKSPLLIGHADSISFSRISRKNVFGKGEQVVILTWYHSDFVIFY